METNQTVAAVVRSEAAAQIRKGRVPKLIRKESSFRLGAATSTVSSAEVYGLYFTIPGSGGFGTKEEAGQVHEFAHQLNEQAKTTKVGGVEKVGVGNNSFEVMLKLDQPAGFNDPDDLVSNAFRSLEGFLTSSMLLTGAWSRHRPAWKYKLNGSVLDEGDF